MEKVIREDLRDLSRIPELSRIEMLASLLPEKVGSLFNIASLREHLEVNHETVKRWVMFLQELFYLFEIKAYLWDFSEVPDKSARYENLVARDGRPWMAVETKWRDGALSIAQCAFIPIVESGENSGCFARSR